MSVDRKDAKTESINNAVVINNETNYTRTTNRKLIEPFGVVCR